ncbi:MAG: hypothetical protein LBP34_05350 [Flavobacteriaceae bacterium]|jgi:hypothetical protein|nr:hypothetical protein [Flavobacteriaceae bacterium]
MENTPVIVIPIYKKEISKNEQISLLRCFKVLGRHKIIFCGPESLDISTYETLLEREIHIERFENEYFKNIGGYNRLMLSKEFYQRFINYDYMLIYQPDCYVFHDELDHWCRQGYDYIGSPWLTYRVYNLSRFKKMVFFSKQFLLKFIEKIPKDESIEYKVGNGGFSLRNPKKFLSILQKINSERLEKYMGTDSYSLWNEDVFWSYEVNKYIPQLKIPFYKKAAGFSLELNPNIGIKMNRNRLPFGCHGWYKKMSFWKQYINEFS